MKIMIAFPPLQGKGTPLLGQNRQFQWFHNAAFIHPMVPAMAATLMKERGHEVIWADYIAEQKSEQDFLALVEQEQPELLAMETKTPVIKLHWAWVEKIKARSPNTKTVLMGDHVTALPEESLKESKVDYVLTGGEIGAMTLVDSIARLIPGTLGNNESSIEESHSVEGVLEYPHYTRPEIFIDKDGNEYPTPKILLSGNHAEIKKWREEDK